MKLTKHRTVSAYLQYWLSSIVQPSTRPTTLRAYSEMVDGTLAPSFGSVGSASGAACEPLSPALWRTARRESRRPPESECLRLGEV